ncbi:hypothetical protein ID47_02205 [Candidatus Paracaedibacter acanthamoebae]|uniref:Uncharacterized protein n=1 Tax=Candidatus Odyssella acanthamoebae TaxID=91604 RepID=A0A077ATT1_9PROT|nr:hypothetical protein ID47_02205 [Candidatus Paracaedibacter acanthamoebae]
MAPNYFYGVWVVILYQTNIDVFPSLNSKRAIKLRKKQLIFYTLGNLLLLLTVMNLNIAQFCW